MFEKFDKALRELIRDARWHRGSSATADMEWDGVTHEILILTQVEEPSRELAVTCVLPAGMPDEAKNALEEHIDEDYDVTDDGLGGLDGEDGEEKLLFNLHLPNND
jgi:hypothetical protein